MNKRTIFSMVCILFQVLAVIQLNADSSSLFRKAGAVQPMQNNNVRMVEEKVDIQVYGGWSVARCEFTFKNESPEEQEVLMGFPASMIGVEDRMIDETTRLRNFKIYDNWMEKEAALEKAEDESAEADRIAEWYTWDIHFQGGEERKIVNTYKTQNYNAPWGRYTGYILKTGAPWKGTIGKAVITFEMMDIASSNIYEDTSPKGYRVDKNKVIWEMQDFEPTEDINLSLSGYFSISNILYGQNEEQRENVRKQVEKARMLFIDGNEEEGLHQVNLLLQKGIYAEELYFCLLNYYHKQGDIEGFIKILKDETQNLNSPYVLEWARVLYPDRLRSEGLNYPENHKPVIKNQAIRKLNETQFELSADVYDEARDMTFISCTAYSNGLTMDSLLEDGDTNIAFGSENFDYRAKGKLPNPYTDLVWRLEASDYKGDMNYGMTLNSDRLGESCYFYTGNTFEPWNLKKDSLFMLCYYDKSFDSTEEEFRKVLSLRLQNMVQKLNINIPVGGYSINLYKKPHLEGLRRENPQNITLYLKSPEYRAKLHNAKAQGKSGKEAGEWDWGEIIAELDINNKNKMVEAILQQILAGQFGSKWQDVKPEIVSSFISAISDDLGKGRYYEAFSNMTKAELTKAAHDIGMLGKASQYAKPDAKLYALVAALGLLTGVAIFTIYNRNKK